MWLAALLCSLFVFDTGFSQNYNSIVNTDVITLKDFVFWPNATIPFFINTDHYDQEQSLAILQALTLFAFKTCLKFTPVLVKPDANQHVLVFQNPKGLKTCAVPTRGHSPDEPELITLPYGCLVSPMLEMIIMKKLGFPFEHNRWIRDLYLEVLLDNVEIANAELFTKDIKLPAELRNLPYDINSVMHFSERDFSKNGHRTIIIKDSKVVQKRLTLTDLDVRKINIVYGPECRKRDHQEKIEMCQQYPGVARRRKREILMPEQNMQGQQDITPLVDEDRKDVKGKDLEDDIRSLVHLSYVIASKILSQRRLKYCGDAFLQSSPSFDVFKILDKMSDFTESIVKDAEKPNFCVQSDSVANYNTAFQLEGAPIKILRSIDFNTSDLIEDDQERPKREIFNATQAVNSSQVIEVVSTTLKAEDDRRSLKGYTAIIPLDEGVKPVPNVNNENDKSDSSDASSITSSEEKPAPKQEEEPKKIEKKLTLDDENEQYNVGHEAVASQVKRMISIRAKSVTKKVKLSNATKDFYSQRKWPNKLVRYYIADDGLHDVEALAAKLGVINDILKQRTCVRIEAIKESDMERFEDFLVLESNATDFVTGRVGGKQIFGSLELFEGNQHQQFTAMMVMAMLGFYFEVSRHDRDEYIKVHANNIRPDKLHHFEKNPPEATIDLPYDYESATHPSWMFWRKENESGIASVATFKSQDPDSSIMNAMGQNDELLSDIDIAKINSVYGIRCFRKSENVKRSKKSKSRSRRRAKLDSNKI